MAAGLITVDNRSGTHLITVDIDDQPVAVRGNGWLPDDLACKTGALKIERSPIYKMWSLTTLPTEEIFVFWTPGVVP